MSPQFIYFISISTCGKFLICDNFYISYSTYLASLLLAHESRTKWWTKYQFNLKRWAKCWLLLRQGGQNDSYIKTYFNILLYHDSFSKKKNEQNIWEILRTL